MAAFAQFGSDLDAVTQRLLNRGARLTELLKQPQFSPLKMEEQVAVIYAGVNGYLDPLPVNQVRAFEDGLLALMRTQHADILEAIRTSRDLSDDMAGQAEERRRAIRREFHQGSCLIEASQPALSRTRRPGASSDAVLKGPSQPHRLRQGDAEDHQGHADGRRGKTAPRAEAAEAARPYAERMEKVLANLAAGISPGAPAPALLGGTGRDQTHLLVVCTGERGLVRRVQRRRSCGSRASTQCR